MSLRYTDEFRREAMKQVTGNEYEIKDTANRLRIYHCNYISLYFDINNRFVNAKESYY